jgi:hypothetical protein
VARSPLGRWGLDALGRPYVEYVVLAGVPLVAARLGRLPLRSFGIRSADLSQQLGAALPCLLPWAVGKALLFPLGPRSLVHSFVEPLVVLGVVCACARVLRPGTSAGTAGLMLVLPFLPGFSPAPLLFYPFFLAPAEELLFRGYVQSRLNEAFGRPSLVLGARFGWALPLTAGLFSLFHVLNVPALVDGRLEPVWFLGIPTFAWGLALGYLRERSDGLVAPILCHGVPQGIAWAFLGLR